MSKKLVKGKDYDGWVCVWPNADGNSMAYTFCVNRRDILEDESDTYKRWAYRRGMRLVRVKLMEVEK